MKRVWASIVCAGMLLGCQTADTTSTAEQALTDCVPGANFCGAQMPPTPWWQKGEQAPSVSSGSMVIVETAPGELLAMVADLGQSKIVWARKLLPKSLGTFIDTTGFTGTIDIRRPPPPPPPPWGGNWSVWGLELSLRSATLTEDAYDACKACYVKP